MLAILDYTRSRIGTITDYEDLEITHELENGDKTISFRYLGTDIIPNEYYVQTDTDRFTIKEVAPDESGSEYHGQLDLEDLQRVPFKRFTSKGQTLTAAAEAALDGTGWTVQTSISTLRNVQRYKVTALEALYAIRDAWMCEISFDNLNKVVTFAETIGEDKGVYFMRGINLKDVSPNYDSYDYVTRLIPYGADGLTIESVNNGIAYVENYQYSTKILTLIWEDTSYEDAQALKEDATKKLADLSKPKKSFSCDVINLAKESSTYSILDYSIGDTIHLVDDLTGTNELQRIVKLVEHPDEPEEDTCEISNTVLTFEELQDRMQKAADAWEEISNTDGTVNGVYVHGVEIDNIVGIEVLVGDGVTTNGAVANVAVLYAQGDSPTEAPTSGWDTTAPEWDSGKYMWQKTVTTYVNGETEKTAETNITGAQGDAGFSPEVTITKEEDKTTISITDATGTKTATIEDGKFIWNLLKEKDIPAVSFTNKGITYEYEGNGWWYIHGTVTGNDVGAVTLYGVDSTGNLITSNSDICVCVEKNTSPLIDDKSRIQIRYAENSSAQTMSDAYISESWSGMKVSVDANGVMHFGSGDVTVDANGIMSFPEMFTDVDQDGVLQFMTYDDRIILNHTHNNGYRVAAIRHYLSADATGTVISGRIRIMLVNGSTVNGWTPNESDVAPVTVMLTNSNHTFAGGASAALGGSVDCAVVAHKGAVPCPAHVGTITGCPTGMSTSISGNNTTAATITITVTTSMATADGTLTVPVTVENQLFNLIFSYSIAKKGKGSQVFHQSTAPSSSLGLEMGDTWFDTANDYEIYSWDGTQWVPEPLGSDAISAGAITASHIAAGAITADMITAGVLTSADGETYFDLTHSEIVAGSGGVTIDYKGIELDGSTYAQLFSLADGDQGYAFEDHSMFLDGFELAFDDILCHTHINTSGMVAKQYKMTDLVNFDTGRTMDSSGNWSGGDVLDEVSYTTGIQFTRYVTNNTYDVVMGFGYGSNDEFVITAFGTGTKILTDTCTTKNDTSDRIATDAFVWNAINRRIRAFQVTVTKDSTSNSQKIIEDSDLTTLFGVTCNANNTAVFFSNADGDTVSEHLEGASHLSNGGWYALFATQVAANTSLKINVVAVYFG